METLTVNRIGEPKTINYTNKKTGKPDSFQKVGIQVNEYPDRWFDFTFRGNHGLAIGNKYEFETESREYNGKTYWDAKFPKKPQGATNETYIALMREFTTLNAKLDRIWGAVDPERNITSAGTPVPDFMPKDEFGDPTRPYLDSPF